LILFLPHTLFFTSPIPITVRLMVDAETISIMFAGLSLGIAAIYYVLNLRRVERQRQTQLLLQMAVLQSSAEKYSAFSELFQYQWEDYEDFNQKYSSNVDVDLAARRTSIFSLFNVFGLMLREKVIDRKLLFDYGASGFIGLWRKFKPIIEVSRETSPARRYLYTGFEHLHDELVKEAKERGIQI
jgi:hypothetical protein